MKTLIDTARGLQKFHTLHFLPRRILMERKKNLLESTFIASKYADDKTYIPKNEEIQKKFKNDIPRTLETHNLTVDKTKT